MYTVIKVFNVPINLQEKKDFLKILAIAILL